MTALKHLRRKNRRPKPLTSDQVELLLQGVTAATFVSRSLKLFFDFGPKTQLKSLDAPLVPALLNVKSDPVLSLLTNLGETVSGFAAALRAALSSARESHKKAAKALHAHSFALEEKGWLVRDEVLIVLFLTRLSAMMKIGRIQPLELEALVQVAGIRAPEEEFSADAKSLQLRAETWKKIQRKAVKEFLPFLEQVAP